MNHDTIAINAVLLGGGRESGVERCIRGLLEALAMHGKYRYRVWAAAGSHLDPLACDRFQIDPVVVPFRSRCLRIAWEQIWLPLKLRRMPHALLHAPGYIAPLAAPPPRVLTVYDLVALRFPHWASGPNAVHYRLMLPASVRRAAAVVTPSTAVREELVRRFCVRESNIHVIAPAVADVFREPSPRAELETVRRRYGLPSRFMLYAGNIEPKKNTEGLLNSYARLRHQRPDVPPLVMVGELAWKTQTFLRRRRELGLEPWVPCVGSVPDQDLRAIYGMAIMLLMPSWYEGFGLPPLEAMACGTPVISSNGGALPETVGSAALVVDAGNETDWVNAMDSLLDDPARREEFSRRGLRHVQQYTAKEVARRHETLYRSVRNAGRASKWIAG